MIAVAASRCRVGVAPTSPHSVHLRADNCGGAGAAAVRKSWLRLVERDESGGHPVWLSFLVLCFF